MTWPRVPDESLVQLRLGDVVFLHDGRKQQAQTLLIDILKPIHKLWGTSRKRSAVAAQSKKVIVVLHDDRACHLRITGCDGNAYAQVHIARF